jgi:4-hydroxy-4-methyl-2-oxoglutarate aldolase
MVGDEGVGVFQPPFVGTSAFTRLPDSLLERVRRLPGAATTGSDVLDDLGLALAVPGTVLSPRTSSGTTVGHALTIAYVPERRALSNIALRGSSSRLAHHSAFAVAESGDVLVIDARGSADISVLGGMAAVSARSAGIAACVVDGGVRDLDEIAASGLAVWSRSVTPRTGKWRLEAFALNLPVVCGGVQVHPGDVVVADHTGVCFFPIEFAEEALTRILATSEEEQAARALIPS